MAKARKPKDKMFKNVVHLGLPIRSNANGHERQWQSNN